MFAYLKGLGTVVVAGNIRETLSAEARAEVDALKVNAHCNLAAAYMNFTPPDYIRAKEEAVKALTIDQHHVKAQFRAIKVNILLGNLDWAKSVCTFSLSLSLSLSLSP
eukprot:TRINITY_DN2552_c0_g1_i8.p3 TRINITY_DN2552_c0_g1~~TRINITY_DN2552_c0_g1_i8.p3  ORF type:complete len:108 (+),score=36.78 TRINITY_DN2552_c0_g1_i8:310-633(+)